MIEIHSASKQPAQDREAQEELRAKYLDNYLKQVKQNIYDLSLDLGIDLNLNTSENFFQQKLIELTTQLNKMNLFPGEDSDGALASLQELVKQLQYLYATKYKDPLMSRRLRIVLNLLYTRLGYPLTAETGDESELLAVS